MGKRKRYSEEFQQQMVRLVRAGRTPEDLGREFEPSAQAIRNWVKQAELDAGTRTDGLKGGTTGSPVRGRFRTVMGDEEGARSSIRGRSR